MAVEYSTLTLKKGAESRVFGGHLWIFSNELREGFQEFEPGSFVRVVDSRERLYGVGSLNPHSLIAVRLFARNNVVIDQDFLFERLDRALAARTKLLGDDHVCRVVFSEADGLPGIIVDRFAELVVFQTLTAGAESLEEDLLEWIHSRLRPTAIVAANDSSMRRLEGLPQVRIQLYGDPQETFLFEQDSLKLLCDSNQGQKTGFFLDQRVNRKLMQSFVRGGESVLDLFCYSGAFGLYAMQAGAGQTTFVDGSERALSLVRDVCERNGFSDRASFVKTDIFEWLKESDQQFDMVSLDPPALAKNRSKATIALRAYRDINARAMKWVKPGGLLLTSSCSGLISRVNWRKVLEEAAFKSRRTVRFVAFGTQAPDHPILAAMPETEYLKFAVAQVS